MEKTAIPFNPRFSSVAAVGFVLLFIVCCTEWIISSGLLLKYFHKFIQKLSFGGVGTDEPNEVELVDAGPISHDTDAGNDISAEMAGPLGLKPSIERSETDETLVIGEVEQDSLGPV